MIIFHLAKAGLKKKKGMAATLIFLSALAALFFNLGLIMSSQMQAACADAIERLQGPDLFIAAEASRYETSFEAFLQDDERVRFVEKEDIIYLESTQNNINSSRSGAIIFNMNTDRQIEPVKLLKEDPSIPENEAIYLPCVMETDGASVGSEYVLTCKNTSYRYRVAGFFETSCMGTIGYSFLKFYMPSEAFQKLYETAGAGKALSVRLQEDLPKTETSRLLHQDFLKATDYYNKVGNLFAGSACISYEGILDSMLSLINIPMTLMISIAFIICVINFITVFFKVREEIENSLPEIGSLQALGYTTWQIILSKTAEYSIPSMAGGLFGIVSSFAALPAIISYTEEMIGISLSYKVMLSTVFPALFFTLMLPVFGAVTAAFKIRRIPPVTALRKGMPNSHYGRNFFPLHKGRFTVIFRLALKNITADFRHNAVTILVSTMGVFAVSLSAVLYANFGYDTSAVAKMTGMEIADIQVTLLPHVDASSMRAQLEALPGVRKTNLSVTCMADIGEEEVFWIITEDFSKTEMLTLTSGSFPQYDNEVTLSSGLMRRLGKKTGDPVRVTLNGITKEYLITGVFTGTNNEGKEGLMSREGIHRLDPYFTLSNIDLYLDEDTERQAFTDYLYQNYGVSSKISDSSPDGSAVPESNSSDYAATRGGAEERIKKMLDTYGVSSAEFAVMLHGELILTGSSDAYQIKEISSLQEYLDGLLASYAAAMIGMMTVFLAVMLLVMGAIISITISSLLRRQRTDFGIYKALGCTTGELIRIVRLNITVNAALGSVAGVLLCRIFANSLLMLLFQNMGVDLAAFTINPVLLTAIALLNFLYVWLLATWKARSVKKITVYDLLTE